MSSYTVDLKYCNKAKFELVPVRSYRYQQNLIHLGTLPQLLLNVIKKTRCRLISEHSVKYKIFSKYEPISDYLTISFFCFVIFDSGNSGSHDHYFETIIILGTMHIVVEAV